MQREELDEADDLLGVDNLTEIHDNNPEQKYIHYQYIADKGQSLLRVDKFLMDRIEGVSRNKIQQAAEANCILVNDKPVKSSYKIKPLDKVALVMDRPRMELQIIPENIPLNIFYEDDDLLIINKPPGLVVHPGHGNYTGTLVNAIAYHLRDMHNFDADDPRLGLVHRIDKDTSGLLIVAKNPYAKTYLAKQFLNKTIKREYVALVWGSLEDNEGIIKENIGRDLKNRLLMRVFPSEEHGKPAVTHYNVAERLGYVTLINCQLETGRTHQIRVHMKHIGHTLFNDERYGGDKVLRGKNTTKYKQFVRKCFEKCPRQCLHAQTLGFKHPTTEKEMLFTSELPDDMLSVIEKWRTYNQSNEL
ncbi:MAG: RluA family pseudouridine synthase [Dysgonamonadaceae bacterium]|nr:RluA family pseudouridine synthase [Dysgonamonadaceae bacterium]MDD4728748.1 RluA family pseudouridine synthase [Dysgonamonadaceae bacterium]